MQNLIFFLSKNPMVKIKKYIEVYGVVDKLTKDTNVANNDIFKELKSNFFLLWDQFETKNIFNDQRTKVLYNLYLMQ
jgi:hypothetical protein